MNHLEILQKFRKDLADMIINRGSTKTAADDHEDWLIGSETTELTGKPLYYRLAIPDGSVFQ